MVEAGRFSIAVGRTFPLSPWPKRTVWAKPGPCAASSCCSWTEPPRRCVVAPVTKSPAPGHTRPASSPEGPATSPGRYGTETRPEVAPMPSAPDSAEPGRVRFSHTKLIVAAATVALLAGAPPWQRRTAGVPVPVPVPGHVCARSNARGFTPVDADTATARKLTAPDFQLINPEGDVSSGEDYLRRSTTGSLDYRVFKATSPIQVPDIAGSASLASRRASTWSSAATRISAPGVDHRALRTSRRARESSGSRRRRSRTTSTSSSGRSSRSRDRIQAPRPRRTGQPRPMTSRGSMPREVSTVRRRCDPAAPTPSRRGAWWRR